MESQHSLRSCFVHIITFLVGIHTRLLGLLLLLGGKLDTGSSDLLVSVLSLLSLLSRSLLDLGGKAVSDLSVGRLKLEQSLGRVVDETEAGGLSSSELGSQAKDGHGVLLGVVGASQLLSQLVLGHVGGRGVQDVNDKLSSAEEGVSDELSGSDSDGVGLG